MSEDLPMTAAAGVMAAAGLVLGALNAWGLWLTSRHITHARVPGLLVLFSLLARTLVPLAALLLLANGMFPRLLAGIVGFVVGRLVTVRVLAAKAHEPSERKETGP